MGSARASSNLVIIDFLPQKKILNHAVHGAFVYPDDFSIK